MSKKTSTALKQQYIKQTHQLYDEYQRLVAEGSDILKSTPEDAALPARADEIEKRLEAIRNTMQSNAIILADMLAEVLNESETS